MNSRRATSVGFVGLGTMGRGMARCVVAAGFDVTAYDLNEVAVKELVELGAHSARSPDELGARCDVALLAVVDEAQVRAVLTGADGVLSRARPGLIVLVHSTIDPAACRELAELAARLGVQLLDAPMTGNAAAAAAGTLSLMVGGDADALRLARPVLDAFASRLVHLGAVGAGQVAKIANNLAIGVNLRGVREALALAAGYGIDVETMLAVLASGGADSWVARSWRGIGASAVDYPGGAAGLAALTHKDMSLALALARDAGLPTPTGEVASELLEDAYLAAYADRGKGIS
jgi:3-hydroxyisobutyrate dehydrogenase-like beta-hydroxyacid dehydrogenase